MERGGAQWERVGAVTRSPGEAMVSGHLCRVHKMMELMTIFQGTKMMNRGVENNAITSFISKLKKGERMV